MSYINHYLKKTVHYIGDYTLGQTYVHPENREIEITSGLTRNQHYEVEAHEVLHKALASINEYLHRIAVRAFLQEVGAPVLEYH